MTVARYRLKYGQWEVPLPDGDFTVGRSPECDLRLDDRAISRLHATFHVGRHGISVEDNRSRNGVYVDGTRVEGTAPVAVGAQVLFGQQALTIVAVDAEAERRAWEEAAPGDATEVVDRAIRAPRALKSGPTVELSPRERQVVSMLARGFTQREISEALGISTKTVETHLRRIRRKTGTRSRATLVEFARIAGIVDEASGR